YYDDLPTRFELAPSLVARMQELGILYDRAADGEYFHIYTDTFAERFFFEIVQRVKGYDAYGALNAPARMAAQAQARQRAWRGDHHRPQMLAWVGKMGRVSR